MDETQKTIIDEMREFRTLLMRFTVLRRKIIEERKKLTSEEEKTLTSLFDEISIDAGKYGPLIKKITGLETIHTGAGPQDIWNWALSIETNILVTNALNNCITATARTIGTLQDDIGKGIRDKETGNLIKKPTELSGKPTEDISLSPLQLFNAMHFHPKIIEASRSLFKTKHYSQAIFEAFKAVNNFVKQKSNLPLDGKALMAQAFKEEAPIIRLNELLTQSERDEQEGFRFLFMGAMVGIRNPKAHDIVVQKDPYKTLEYLAFASLLIKKVDFWEAD